LRPAAAAPAEPEAVASALSVTESHAQGCKPEGLQVASRLIWSNQRFEQITSWWLLGFCLSFLTVPISTLTTLTGINPTGQGLCLFWQRSTSILRAVEERGLI
jgi:hypothetical protein